MRPMTNNRRVAKCVFCGGARLTKEHVFPKWLHRVLPRPSASTVHETTWGFPALGEARRYKGRLNQTGDPLSKRLKIVCGECNNGWMSGLQERAHQLVTMLVQDRCEYFGDGDQESLAAWICMTSMVIEFADLATVAVPATARVAFANTRRPPPNWLIFVGRYEGVRESSSFWHVGVGVHDAEQIDQPRGCNIQITTFNLGRTIFHSISNDSKELVLDLSHYATGLGLAQIWPTRALPTFSTFPKLNDDGYLRVQRYLRDYLEGLARNSASRVG